MGPPSLLARGGLKSHDLPRLMIWLGTLYMVPDWCLEHEMVVVLSSVEAGAYTSRIRL